jgi:hypothetical protein
MFQILLGNSTTAVPFLKFFKTIEGFNIHIAMYIIYTCFLSEYHSSCAYSPSSK